MRRGPGWLKGGATTPQVQLMTRLQKCLFFSLFLPFLLLTAWLPLVAQSNTRLLLAEGTGVPGHTGFFFSSFSSLAMNGKREIVFLSSLKGPRNELRAVVKSSGVSFSVVAFQGLQAPIPKTSYDSFSAPSLNDAGVICFSAVLKDAEGNSSSAIIRLQGSGARAILSSDDSLPGTPGAPFLEFSAPLVNSQGNILLGARWGGSKPGTGLFLWTPRELRRLDLPAGFSPLPADLLEPIFFSGDEAALARRGTSPQTALEQFFRALAVRSFQEIQPPPDAADTFPLLDARLGQPPVQLVLVVMEGDNVQTALLPGDPSLPVMAKRIAGAPEIKPLARIEGQTTSAQDDIIFAAASLDAPDDLALYQLAAGQVTRLTSPGEFTPFVAAAPGKAILSLTGDSQQTEAFIVPGSAAAGSAIYATSIP